MKILLQRAAIGENCTIGFLVADNFRCYTLEDRVREKPGVPVSVWKIPGQTAIPKGTYKVIINMSQRFGKELPLLERVEGFSGVRIHAGNRSKDTEGCILLGTKLGVDHESIENSREAMSQFMQVIGPVFARGEDIWIDVK